MTDTFYILPDIHGHKDKLDHALALIEADGGPDAPIVFLGDYVDRGPDSRGVLQTLLDGTNAGRNWQVLRGNHDQLFLDFLDHGHLTSPRLREPLTWLHPRMGGCDTLASYGVKASEDAPNRAAALRAVPVAHRDFLAGLRVFHATAGHVFVHAGLRPGVPLNAQAREDLIWIRDPFLSDLRDHGRLVVHGHTALDFPRHHGNRINLDGGAGWGRPLRPALIQGRECWLLTDDGRQALAPS